MTDAMVMHIANASVAKPSQGNRARNPVRHSSCLGDETSVEDDDRISTASAAAAFLSYGYTVGDNEAITKYQRCLQIKLTETDQTYHTQRAQWSHALVGNIIEEISKQTRKLLQVAFNC